jgi:DNA-binding response OmpR family regulator
MRKETKKSAPVIMSDGRPPRLLLIDDDTFIAELYIRTLKAAGFDVQTAQNGEVGLLLAREFKPNIIILDVLMPGIDGFETMERFKKDKESPDCPVIFLSSLCQREDVERGTQLGAAAYLAKQRTVPADVLAKVKEVLCLS